MVTIMRTCPICSTTTLRDHTVQTTFHTVQCSNCDLIFTQNITQEELDRFYDSSYFNNAESVIGYKDYIAEERGHRANAQRLLRTLDKAFPLRGKTLLDVGCAAGFLLDEARGRFGCRVFGVEPSTAIHDHARDVLGIDVRTTELERAGFAPEFFDVVLLVGTIEHLLDPRSVIESITKLLKPGGLFALTTIDTKGLIPLYAIKPPEHIIYFSHQNLRMLLQQCGYSNIQHTTWLAKYRVSDLFHRLYEFSGFRPFRWLETLAHRFAGNAHWSIPTNEMLVWAQKPK